jgi:peptide/nickel transport system substrate-binding protein
MKRESKGIFSILALVLIISVLLLACAQPAAPAPTPTAPVTPAPAAPAPTPSTPTAPTPAAPSPSPSAPAAPTPAAPKPAPATTPRYGGILTYVDRFNPSQPIGAPWEAPLSVPSESVVLDKLLGQESDGTIAPELATSWEVDTSPESPSITLHLRKGVKFHDGTPFNAEAVKWNLQMFKDGGRFPSCRYQKSFDVIDDYTIKINLTEWRNTFLPIFAGIQGYMVSPTAYQTKGIDWMRWHMVGTGPFKQVDFQSDVSLTVVRNDDYWDKGKPYMEGIKFLYVADELTRATLLKAGEGDVMICTPAQAVDFQKLGFTIVSHPSGLNALMPDGINADSPWSNIKVREAAEYAIDKEAMVKAFGYGYLQAAYQLPSQYSTAYTPSITGRKYDPEKAKQLLAEAGFPNGFKTTIIAPAKDDMLMAIQSYWQAVGIDTALDFAVGGKFSTYMGGTWDNACLSGAVIEIANYNTTFNNFLSSPPALYKSVKQPDNWKELYLATVNSPEVDPKLQQKCVQAFYDEASIIPLYYRLSLWALRPNIQGSGIGDKTLYWSPQNTWLSK